MYPCKQRLVALLAEGVDRNTPDAAFRSPVPVALLAEGVDRNLECTVNLPVALVVALLAEGVDRNIICVGVEKFPDESPSSQRAWIEIGYKRRGLWPCRSPSSQRAWIEIPR